MVARQKPHLWRLRGSWRCLAGLSFAKGRTAREAYDEAIRRADLARRVGEVLSACGRRAA